MEAIKVNLIPNGIPQMCHASQYDEGRQIRLDLFDGFTPYVIQSGDTFTLNVRKPDNHVVVERSRPFKTWRVRSKGRLSLLSSLVSKLWSSVRSSICPQLISKLCVSRRTS